jgi:hypothetical protein
VGKVEEVSYHIYAFIAFDLINSYKKFYFIIKKLKKKKKTAKNRSLQNSEKMYRVKRFKVTYIKMWQRKLKCHQ